MPMEWQQEEFGTSKGRIVMKRIEQVTGLNRKSGVFDD
jgi:hypothetical protein